MQPQWWVLPLRARQPAELSICLQCTKRSVGNKDEEMEIGYKNWIFKACMNCNTTRQCGQHLSMQVQVGHNKKCFNTDLHHFQCETPLADKGLEGWTIASKDKIGQSPRYQSIPDPVTFTTAYCSDCAGSLALLSSRDLAIPVPFIPVLSRILSTR